MFYRKRIEMLEERLNALELRVQELAFRSIRQDKELLRLLKAVEEIKQEPQTPTEQKLNRKYRRRKTNGKETTEATE